MIDAPDFAGFAAGDAAAVCVALDVGDAAPNQVFLCAVEGLPEGVVRIFVAGCLQHCRMGALISFEHI